MVKTRKISLMAVVLALLIAIMPMFSMNAAAYAASPFEDVKTGNGIYKVALLDADFHDSQDGCLTPSEESKLLELMQNTADKIKCNISIVITSDIGQMSDVDYIKSFHAEMFGEYSDSISLLLLNTHGNPYYSDYADQIYYTDRGYDLFHEKINNIFDRLYNALDKDEDDFYGACSNFCTALNSYGTESDTGSDTAPDIVLPNFNINETLKMVMMVPETVISIIILKSLLGGCCLG